MAADAESDEVFQGLTLKILEDGTIVVEGTVQKYRLNVSRPDQIPARRYTVLVDPRDRSYRTFRFNRDPSENNDRIQAYLKFKGLIALKSDRPNLPEKPRTQPSAIAADLTRSLRSARRLLERGPRVALVSSTNAQSTYFCDQVGDIMLTTYDPFDIWLVESRSFAYSAVRWGDWGSSLQAQTYNWQNPGPYENNWRTTALGTTWYRDVNSSWVNTTPPSSTSLYARAEQSQDYFNTDFCPVGFCGYTQVNQYLYAEADQSVPSRYAVAYHSKSGTYQSFLHYHLTDRSGWLCGEM